MSTHDNSFEKIRERIESSLENVTKCYILIKYAYNSAEEDDLYKKEFKKRYINFYKTITNIEKDIDRRFMNEINGSLKRILNIDFYKAKMSFLDSIELNNELDKNDNSVDEDYDKKASNSTVKLNFYHSNKVEFGSNTRFHVNTTKYGVIDPRTHTEEENIYMFSALTDYYIYIFNKENNIKSKKYTKDM